MTWQGTLYFDPAEADPMWQPQEEPAARYVGEFDADHQRRLYEFLCRRAQTITGKYSWELALSGVYSGAPDDVAIEFEHEDMDRHQRPLRWLLSTPFMVALSALIVGHGSVGKDLIATWEREAAHPGIMARFGGTPLERVAVDDRPAPAPVPEPGF